MVERFESAFKNDYHIQQNDDCNIRPDSIYFRRTDILSISTCSEMSVWWWIGSSLLWRSLLRPDSLCTETPAATHPFNQCCLRIRIFWKDGGKKYWNFKQYLLKNTLNLKSYMFAIFFLSFYDSFVRIQFSLVYFFSTISM